MEDGGQHDPHCCIGMPERRMERFLPLCGVQMHLANMGKPDTQRMDELPF